MLSKKANKNKDILTISFVSFFSVIAVLLFAVFILFNVVKIKDLNLDKTVFASSEIDLEMLGFSDMTLSEFIKVFQTVSSPDERRILSKSPQKNDITALNTDLEANNLSGKNINSLLTATYGGVLRQTVLSERGLCLISDMLAPAFNVSEIKNITDLCGENSVEVKNIRFYTADDGIFAHTVVSVNIETVRNKILQNFGYPVFQICGKLYFLNIYKLYTDNGELKGEQLSSVIYNTNEENTDKLLNALFTAYYMSQSEENYVIDNNALSHNVLDIILTAVNNLGTVSIENYSGNRKDIKQNEIVLIIN